MNRRFSKLKKKIEDLFLEDLGLAIHANVYVHGTGHDSFRCPRIWLQADKHIIFDFPGPFFLTKNPEERSSVPYFEETPIIGKLIDEYIATAPAELMSKTFERDRFGFTDLLKVADRRIGKGRLQEKFGNMPDHTPIGALLKKRLTGTPIPPIAPIEYRYVDLEPESTGLPCLVRARTVALRAGYANPAEPPTVRVLERYRDGKVEIQFAIEIADQPTIVAQHLVHYQAETMAEATLSQITTWILLNRVPLLSYWHDGFDWNKEQSQAWATTLKPLSSVAASESRRADLPTTPRSTK